mmetsp:Transcript_30541/g.60457  ORF Transcript_30541/g.60457 Transcript_30541/m.60457 type:complete len:93 (+) Transcript_30541:1180-1458(+)
MATERIATSQHALFSVATPLRFLGSTLYLVKFECLFVPIREARRLHRLVKAATRPVLVRALHLLAGGSSVPSSSQHREAHHHQEGDDGRNKS